MSRRNNAAARCGACRMHASLCLCAELPRLETETRLLLLIHKLEDRKPTNTGRLATMCLPNSAVVVRGHEGAREAPLDFGDRTPLLLYPDDEATPLDALDRSRRYCLVVPDGTWRQASKMQRRVPGLATALRVRLPPGGGATAYRLRSEPKDGGLATVEAIARAFGVLEGPAVRAALELAFRKLVERTLWARGELAADTVTGGIPAGAQRHDPRSGAVAEAFFRRVAPTAGGLR